MTNLDELARISQTPNVSGSEQLVFSHITTFLELETWQISGEPSALEKSRVLDEMEHGGRRRKKESDIH